MEGWTWPCLDMSRVVGVGGSDDGGVGTDSGGAGVMTGV